MYQSHDGGTDERGARVDVEPADEVLLAEVEVDGAVVDRRVRARALDEAEHGAGLRVDDGERVEVAGAQRHPRGRVVLPRPHPAGRRLLQLGQLGRPLERLRAERLRVRLVDRPLEGRGEDVPVEHARVRVVEDRRLDRPREQRLRLAHEVLVERVLARDQDGEPGAAAAGPAPLLPQRRDRPGEADRDRAVERADVDPELERVGGRHAEQLARHQPLLDLAPLRGRVAGAVGRQPRGDRRLDPVGT